MTPEEELTIRRGIQQAQQSGDQMAELNYRRQLKTAAQPPQPMQQAQPQHPSGIWEQMNRWILESPIGRTAAEFASAVNRGVVGLADIPPQIANDVAQLLGQGRPVPTLGAQPIVREATTGQFMGPGLLKRAVRTGGEFVGPAAGLGQVFRSAAARIPATAAPTVREGVIRAMASKPMPEMVGAAAAGAGTEFGAEVGEEIGGEGGGQIGRLIGGIVAPVGLAMIKETGRALVSQSAKKLLSEAAPTIKGLKTAARGVYQEIDNLGVTVKPSGTAKLSNQLKSSVRKEGFNPTIHPKVAAALKEFDSVAGQPQTLSEIDILRRVARAASRSADPDEARIGGILTSKVDDFLDTAAKTDFSKTNKDIGAKYKDARQLWLRAKKAELIEDAFSRADLQATGFENGIRAQFRSILNNKNKLQGFTSEEISAMRQVVKGTSLQNTAKMLGRFGFSEGQASNMLMGYAGMAGGAAIAGGPGAIAVPLLGQMSRNLAQKLTVRGGRGVDLIVRAGNNAPDVAKAYMKAVPAKQRTAQELTELLLRPEISLEGLKMAAARATGEQKRLINDAAFLVTAIKAYQPEATAPVEAQQ